MVDVVICNTLVDEGGVAERLRLSDHVDEFGFMESALKLSTSDVCRVLKCRKLIL